MPLNLQQNTLSNARLYTCLNFILNEIEYFMGPKVSDSHSVPSSVIWSYNSELKTHLNAKFNHHHPCAKEYFLSHDELFLIDSVVDALYPTEAMLHTSDAGLGEQTVFAEPVVPTVQATPFYGSEFNSREAFRSWQCNRCRRHSRCSCDTSIDSFWFWMYILSSNRTTESHHYHHNDSEKKTNPLLTFIIGLTVIALLASAVLAAIYLFGQLGDMIERLVHNEGRSYAGVSLAWFAVSAAGSFTAASFLVPVILTATMAANPVAWSIFGIIALGLVFSALTQMIFPGIIQPIFKKDIDTALKESSFIKEDLGRVQLTDSEKDEIYEKGYDPYKVATAIAIIRRSMGPNEIPNRFGFHAFFDASKRTEEQSDGLETIRLLRSARFDKVAPRGVVTIGEININLRQFEAAFPSAPPAVTQQDNHSSIRLQ